MQASSASLRKTTTEGVDMTAVYDHRIYDALLTRLSNDDDPEKSLSTFANEMTCSAMILGLATPKTLVLIDELGRGTSPREGVGISHAIAEALIEAKVGSNPQLLLSPSFDIRPQVFRVLCNAFLRLNNDLVPSTVCR